MRFLLTIPLALAFSAASAQSNRATVAQTGGATATVTQSGTVPGGGGNLAVVDQNGANETTVTQAGNRNNAVVDQSGNGNTATLIQPGSNNDGLIYQGNAGRVTPVSAGSASNNGAGITQSGSHNRGRDENMLSPYDGGIVYQGVRGGTAIGNTATVTQAGDYGLAWTTQGDFSGTATGSTTIIDQSGLKNDANTVQGYFASSSAATSRAEITQASGTESNDAYVSQGVNGTSANDRATVVQTGSFDAATVRQGSADAPNAPLASRGHSSGNTAAISQGGTGAANFSNQASIVQGFNGGTATDNGAATVQFAGTNGNTALVLQGFETLTSGSQAFTYQNSDDNRSTITQSGFGHTATVTQN